MDEALRKTYDAARNLALNPFKSACYAPFVSMFFTTSGNVVACCKSQTLSVGNVGHERLDAIWNGQKIEEFRRASIAYRLPADCGFCEWQIKGGDFASVFARNFDEFGADDAEMKWPKVMEFAISNDCNLECVMCTGESSSRIRARREHLPPLASVYGEDFFVDLRKYLPHLKLAKFLGGEPFLMPGNFRIWEMMIADGLTTRCIITTNGTRFDDKVQRVLDRLPVSIVFSIDGATKKTLEAIRIGAEYETLLANAQRFIDYTRARGTTFNFIFSLMRENWREFGDFLLMAERMGVATDISTVVYPAQFSLFALPPARLLKIVEELERRDAVVAPQLKLNLPIWKTTLASLRGHATPSQTSTAPLIQGTAASIASYESGEATDHYGRAYALASRKLREEAIEEALKADATDVWYYMAVLLAARLERELGRDADAERHAGQAIAIAPKRPEAYVERAWLRLRQARLDEGIADAGRAHELLASCPLPDLEHELCCLAGILFVRAGRPAEAQLAVTRLFELRPDDALSFVRRGWVWHSAGRPAEALADARAALALEPHLAEAKDLEASARSGLATADGTVR